MARGFSPLWFRPERAAFCGFRVLVGRLCACGRKLLALPQHRERGQHTAAPQDITRCTSNEERRLMQNPVGLSNILYYLGCKILQMILQGLQLFVAESDLSFYADPTSPTGTLFV